MKIVFVCKQLRLFELSSRVQAPSLARGELITYQEQTYQIADIEHIASPDGGVDRVRLQTQVYLRELDSAELASRREHQVGSTPTCVPLRY